MSNSVTCRVGDSGVGLVVRGESCFTCYLFILIGSPMDG